MQIIPAIDVMNGKCVRLAKGDFSKKTIYSEDPVAIAKTFMEAGFERLHIVDLDGAKQGSLQNIDVLRSVASATNLKIDFSGGIKSIADVKAVFDAGASIITLGSIAATHSEIVEEWLLEFGHENFLIGADVMNEQIKIKGWQQDAGINIFEFIGKMLAIGIENIFCTDISKDGMMHGPSIDLYKKILEKFPSMNLIASGGVGKIEDVVALNEIGCKGVIIGKAIYEGKISLSQLSTFN